MSSPAVAIRAEGLWKTYRIHPPGTPRSWWRRGSTEFHALRDVAFEVPEGAVLGIVGPNGAGKSTLLKVLSRITDPSQGSVRVAGRVASLLEVGTGFHPELTGLENVYLNAAIHGLKRREVRQRLDDILAFAEIGEFLDEPVKRYSSGMYLRLAFSIAAHLDPDILIVDELLAVGDAAFRERCLGKMRDVAGSGRTVVLVSHDLGIVRTLATHALLLRRGRAEAVGPVEDVVQAYLAASAQDGGRVQADAQALRLGDVSARCDDDPAGGCHVRWTFALTALRDVPWLHVDVVLEAPSGARLLQIMSPQRDEPASALASGERLVADVSCRLPALPPGGYSGTVYVHGREPQTLLHVSGVPLFSVPCPPQHPECLAPSFSAVILPPRAMSLRRERPA